MANQLKMAQREAIKALRACGWSYRRIARELDVHRETVARYAPPPAEGSKPAKVPIGSDPATSSSARVEAPGQVAGFEVPTGSVAPQAVSKSQCEAFRAAIEAKLDQGLSAQRIWQDLRESHGFEGSYDSVKRFTRRFRQACDLPYRRMEVEPGQEAQIDFGKGAWIVEAGGKRRRSKALRMVLSHSRKGYTEATFREDTESFIRAVENAFWAWQGVPATLVIDNLRAAVSKADWFDPELNPKVAEFCRHYGTAILPTRPRTPRHKGKVERGVDYVQQNALKGRTFATLAEENRHLYAWEERVADTRIHGTTKEQVRQAFETRERGALRALPPERFPFFYEGERVVHRDGHVEVERAYYSVPPEYVGRTVWVRWDARLVRVFNRRFEQIGMHVKGEPGRFSTARAHLSSKKISMVEQGASSLLKKARGLGPHAQKWGAAMLEQRGVAGVRVLVGLLALTRNHAAEKIDRACKAALSHGAYRLRAIRELLKRDVKQETFGFLEDHPLIRSLSAYGRIVNVRFRAEETAPQAAVLCQEDAP